MFCFNLNIFLVTRTFTLFFIEVKYSFSKMFQQISKQRKDLYNTDYAHSKVPPYLKLVHKTIHPFNYSFYIFLKSK